MREIRLVLLLCFLGVEVFASGLYGNYLQHEGSKWALAELEKNSEYLGTNSIVDRFYVNTFNSNIRRFNDIETFIAQFNAPNAQEQAAREVLYSDMDEIDEQINALDAAYPTLSESAKIQNMQERKGLFEQRFAKFRVLLVQQGVIKNRTDSLLLQAEEINYYIAPTDVLEINEKKINALYFKTLARGITQLSDTDKQIVASLTPLCPMIAGKGVYRARLLEKLYTYTTYQDNENCIVNTNPGGGEGSKVAKKQTDLSKDIIKVYPNPTHELLNIEAATSQPYQVIIRDVTGRLLHQEEVNYQTQLSVADYIGGLYICEFWQNNKCISKEKIVIIH